MSKRTKLSSSMTLQQFENGYWYAEELTDFSEKIGIPSARFYLSGSNILDIINPFPYKDANLSSWMDYPIMRSFNLGVNIAI